MIVRFASNSGHHSGTSEIRSLGWRATTFDQHQCRPDIERSDSATHPKEEKMKQLPEALFWFGLISIPLAWVVWYLGPQMEMVRPVLASISDPALRAALQEAHAERLGLWVAVWPVTLLVLSLILEKKVQE